MRQYVKCESREDRKNVKQAAEESSLKKNESFDGNGLLIDDETSVYEVDLECMRQKDKR
jgi:hypothetical protein